jgi:hypothetical protein
MGNSCVEGKEDKYFNVFAWKQGSWLQFTICISMHNEMIWYVYDMHRDK